MNVKLLAYTPEPEKVVAAAAKLCYASSDINTLLDNLTPEKTTTFLDTLSDLGHESPFEHVSFTFGIEGVSRALLAQITRHRIASFSVQSQRYVNKSNFSYIIPPAIDAIPEAKEEFLRAMEEDKEHYEKLASILKAHHLEEMAAGGKTGKSAEKAASKAAYEDARSVLPNACDTKIIMTMNVRSLNNFFTLRCCSRAQWEIRQLADIMLSLVKEIAPKLFVFSGPPCLRGKCPEGTMSCGQASFIKQKYLGEKK